MAESDRSGLLASKVALVTGGASGIGAAICMEFAAQGAAVAIVDVDRDKADRMVEQMGGAKRQVMAAAADVAISGRLRRRRSRRWNGSAQSTSW